MAGTSSIAGLVSGLDTTSLITQLMQIESAPQTLLKTKQTNTSNVVSALQALNDERASLAQALRSAPMAVDNLINAYDAKHSTLDGRGDLNELSIWHTGNDGPPMLLPSTGSTHVSDGVK